MRKLFAILCFVFSAFFSMEAQECHKDWYEVDSVVVYKAVDLSQYETLYLLPIKETGVELRGKESEQEKMRKALDEFRELISFQIGKRYENLKILIVDTLPESVSEAALYLDLDIPDFGLGSKAARAWGGFGAGAQHTDLSGWCFTGNGEKVFYFYQHRSNSAMGQISNGYYPVMKRTEKVLGNDICNIFNAMAGKKITKTIK